MKTLTRTRRVRIPGYVGDSLPRGWQNVKFSQVAESRLGKMLDQEKNTGTQTPYLRNPNVQWFNVDVTDVQTVPIEPKEIEKYALRAGDVLICEGGEAGRSAVWNNEVPNMIFQKAIHRVRPSEDLHNRFLVYQLMYDYQNGRLADYYTGTTIKHLTGQDLAEYEFPLPPLAEQKRIAGILDKADAIRRKRQRAIELTEQFLRSTFLHMFGDPKPEWERRTFNDLADGSQGCFVNGPFGSNLLTRELTKEGVPALYIRDIRDAEYKRVSKVCVTPRKADELDVCRVDPGDVLVAKVGDPPGTAAIYPAGQAPGIITQDLVRIRVNRKIVTPSFLCAFLNSPTGFQTLQPIIVEATRMRFSLGGFKKLELRLPPKPLQDTFEKITDSVRSTLTVQREAVRTSDNIFNSLVQRAFRGEL